MSAPVALVWFRLDLRLADQPALAAALRLGGTVIPVFVESPEEEAPWAPGGASRWWQHHSLACLDSSLHALGSRLIVRRGPALDVLRTLARESGATAIFWNRRYEPAVVARDTRIKEALRADGLTVTSFNGALLHEPWEIRNQAGEPFRVFTPYWRNCLAHEDPPAPLPAPTTLPPVPRRLASVALPELRLLPTIPWAEGFAPVWQPGESGAHLALARFLAQASSRYDTERDRPDHPGTSRLSPHLHFGEISPRQIWAAVRAHAGADGHNPAGGWRTGRFLTEVGWREFAYHQLHHFPHTTTRPLRPEWERFPWQPNPAHLRAWQRGQTGYPLVDAGMRELWVTGWMHNRVRMIVASFLVKHLQQPWTDGTRWFWDTLVDADLAANGFGWQWTAGCGADAAPYFRIFNPVSQGEKFDPAGEYVRRWVPELARLPAEHVHAPWLAPAAVLRTAGVTLGGNYPRPIVDHAAARTRALAAYQDLKTATGTA